MRDIIYWNGIRKVVIEEDRWGEEWRQRKEKKERIHPRPFLSFDFQLFHRRYLYSRITPHRILANTLHVFFTTPFSLPTPSPSSICERHKRVTRSNFHDRARERLEYWRGEGGSIRRDERAEVVPRGIRHATGNRQKGEYFTSGVQ